MLHKQLKESDTKKLIICVGVNPSVAGQIVDGKIISDNTFNKVKKIGEHHGCTDSIMLNLCPLVATDVTEVDKYLNTESGLVASKMFSDNHAYVELVINSPFDKIILVGWGKHDKFNGMQTLVDSFMMKYRMHNLKTLKINSDGSPKHPLFCSFKSELLPYT